MPRLRSRQLGNDLFLRLQCTLTSEAIDSPLVDVKDFAMALKSRSGNSDQTASWQIMLVCVSLLVIPGCGDGGPSLVKAKGKVLVDGTPASGAILLFHPKSSPKGDVANAIADENGVFSPLTGIMEGIPEGEYRVTVVWPDPKAKSGAEGVKFGVAESKDRPDLLKGKYVARDRSKLSVVISRSKMELEPLELSSK